MNAKELDNLAQQIQTMSTRSTLYRVLKRELSARGWWKNRPRGAPNPNIREFVFASLQKDRQNYKKER